MSGTTTESDSSDEFFDAEDTTPSRITKYFFLDIKK